MKKICWLVIALLLCSFFASASADTVLYVDAKTSDRVHLRAGPSASSDSLGLYFSGTIAVLESAAPDWTRVMIGTERGYMKTEYLSNTPPASMEPIGTVHGGSLNLRPRPSKAQKAVATLASGDTLVVHGETHSGWYYVSTSAIDGYVRSEYVSLGQPRASSYDDFFNKGSDAKRYRDVALSNSPFFNWDTRSTQYAENVPEPGTPGSYFSGFALADFDGDGAAELALRLGEDYGALILKCYANGVMGCTLTYRAFNQPKIDGTFSYSGGAAESGFGHIRLDADGVHTVDLVHSFSDGAENIGYEVYGRRATQASFLAALDEQAAKPDLVWYPLSSLSDILQ